ncbi:hypothetical protein BDW42DRAFT_135557 [Aspergillus taichungensis]|uniref:Uncharacterized protein n=1 Tax=Aspergillus taichungensis TaxID=482145 RepID=A0A2J5HP98_9EURO|nr:hypothetical protein BDW42DRAFT_135557 [Aspergillus taichungensis]
MVASSGILHEWEEGRTRQAKSSPEWTNGSWRNCAQLDTCVLFWTTCASGQFALSTLVFGNDWRWAHWCAYLYQLLYYHLPGTGDHYQCRSMLSVQYYLYNMRGAV